MVRTRTLLRYLRIATTVFFVVLCVLLIVLWVRSFWRRDSIWGFYPPNMSNIQATSQHGWIYLVHMGSNTSSEPIWGGSIGPSGQRTKSPISIPHWSMLGVHVLRFANPKFDIVVAIPHWLPFLLTAALAALPWIKWRFSLRTLLIGMTLVALICGAIAVT